MDLISAMDPVPDSFERSAPAPPYDAEVITNDGADQGHTGMDDDAWVEPAEPEGPPEEPVSRLRKNSGHEPDPVQTYLAEIRKAARLTPAQERALARRVSKGDQRARRRMIEANLPFVVYLGKHYRNRGLPFADIIQEGNIGLMRAVEKFDYRKGFRFSTYAAWWIKQAIERALINQTRIIRLPIHIAERLHRYYATQDRLTQALGREPTAREVGRAMKTTTTHAEDLRRLRFKTCSLDAPMSAQDQTLLMDRIEDDARPGPGARAEDGEQREHLLQRLATLKPKEQQVVILRFGLNGSEPQTLETVGRALRVTRERVRQIEAEALTRLRARFNGRKRP